MLPACVPGQDHDIRKAAIRERYEQIFHEGPQGIMAYRDGAWKASSAATDSVM